MHVPVPVRDAAVAHQDHDLVDGFGVLREVVPERGRVVGVREVGFRITFLRVDEVRELGGISEEEDGRVVRHDVPVALVRLHLDGEAARVPRAVVRAGLAAHRREADGDGARLAFFAEDVGDGEVRERVRALEVAVGAAALGVDDALGDPLAVEVREQVDQVEVLQEQGTVLACPLGLVRVRLRHAVA